DLIKYDKNKHRFISPSIAKHQKDVNTRSEYFSPLLSRFEKKDVAATVDKIFEDVTIDFINDAVEA
ncbi:MAG: hypothetical protein ABEH43_10410, partial [Flavobacteriales bacterium]